MAASLSDSVGDGCTLWFDGNWRHCCDVHDVAYTTSSGKLMADFDLAVCVAQTGHPGIALIMLAGVTLFGWIFYRRIKR